MTVIVRPTVGEDPEVYPTGTGINYDQHGFVVIVSGDGDNPRPLAVWAPGQWQRAELRDDPS